MFNVITHGKKFFALSIILVVAGIISLFAQGINWDMDFVGGTSLQINLGQEFENSEIEEMVAEIIGTEPVVRRVGDTGHEVMIQTISLESDMRDAIYTALAERFDITDMESAIISSESFSAIVGQELRTSALWALIIVIALVLIYITIRFEFLSGIATILTMAHDIFIMIAVQSIFQLPVNLTFVAAILTILGLSINNTIVVFDRVRENLKSSKKGTPIAETVNSSIWQTMRRSVITSSTTFLMVLLLFILGVPSLRQFALPLMVGIAVGTYSSIFIVGPLWLTFIGKESKS